MTRAQGSRLAWGGLVVWIVLLLALVGVRLAGYSSLAVVTFPLWGPPAAYVAFVLACWALGLALAFVWLLLRPFLR